MTKLENWSVTVRTDSPYQAPELGFSCLQGEVYNHPVERHYDGKEVMTGELVMLNTKARKAITKSREYQLGTPDPQWLEYLKENQYKLEDYNIKE